MPKGVVLLVIEHGMRLCEHVALNGEAADKVGDKVVDIAAEALIVGVVARGEGARRREAEGGERLRLLLRMHEANGLLGQANGCAAVAVVHRRDEKHRDHLIVVRNGAVGRAVRLGDVLALARPKRGRQRRFAVLVLERRDVVRLALDVDGGRRASAHERVVEDADREALHPDHVELVQKHVLPLVLLSLLAGAL